MVAPSVIVTATNAVLITPFSWLFMYQLGWGLNGAAAAYFCVTFTSLLLFILSIVRTEQRRSPEQRQAPQDV